MWWEGQHVLSHGTNFSAGVAILFSSALGVTVVSTTVIVKGQVLLVKVDVIIILFLECLCS